MNVRMARIASLAAIWATVSSPAYAYLDAGTGSIMIQAIIGAVASAMLFGRVYLAKAKAFFSRSKAATSKFDAD